jgi:hypothetical protein
MDLKTGRAVFVGSVETVLEKAASHLIKDRCGGVEYVGITAFREHFTQSCRPTHQLHHLRNYHRELLKTSFSTHVTVEK